MLDCADRTRVEAIKRARTISIVINQGADDELTLTIRGGQDIKKLTHDIAISFQDFFNRRRI